MGKRSTPAKPDAETVGRLTAAVEVLSGQVRQLALVMDEIREDLLGAVRHTGLDPGMTRRRMEEILAQNSEAKEKSDDEVDDIPVTLRRVPLTDPRPSDQQGTLFS